MFTSVHTSVRFGFLTSGVFLNLSQVRVEELEEGVETPPDVWDCQFQVTPKFQYTQKVKDVSAATSMLSDIP